jgi:hypothetical protein
VTTERIESNGLILLAFHPMELGLYADVRSGNRAVPHTAAEALYASGAEAVLDGPMFEKCDPSRSYLEQACGIPSYRHFDLSSVDIPTSYPNRGVTISVLQNGNTQAVTGSAVPPNARVSVQLYPELVRNGRVVGTRDDGPASRAALAVLRDGRMAFVVSQPMSMPEFSEALVAAGALYAGYTDGGGSTSLQTTGFYAGSREHRRVITWLVAKARPSPSAGSGLIAAVALTAAVGALLWCGAKKMGGVRSNPRPRWWTLAHDSHEPGDYSRDDVQYKGVMPRRHGVTIKTQRTFTVYKYETSNNQVYETDRWEYKVRNGKLVPIDGVSFYDYMMAEKLFAEARDVVQGRRKARRNPRRNPSDGGITTKVGPYLYRYHWVDGDGGVSEFVVRRMGPDEASGREWVWRDVLQRSKRGQSLPTSALEQEQSGEVERLPLADYMACSKLWEHGRYRARAHTQVHR